MTVRLIVPYRSDGGWRDRLWEYVIGEWLDHMPGISPIVGASPDGAFNRSAAINRAAQGDWDVGIIADADTIPDWETVANAVDAIEQETPSFWLIHPYAIPNGRIMATEAFTKGALRGPSDGLAERAVKAGCGRDPYVRFRSGVVVIGRALWEAVGGFDERFVGWGGEDDAFADACATLGSGVARHQEQALVHLFHPSAKPDQRDQQLRRNQQLAHRYRRATRSVRAMEALLVERPQ